jgi:hypothetical protein
LVCSLLGVAPAAADEPVLLDEVVAVVESRPITLSELEIEARLQRAFETSPQALREPLDRAVLATMLDRLIDELVVWDEAERLQVFRLGSAEVSAARVALEARLGGALFQRFLAEYEIDDRTLRDILERQMRVARYLDGRFRLASRPRDADVRAYFEAHASDFGRRPLEAVADEVRARVQKERMSALSQRFVADVRKRANVRILRSFGGRDESGRRSGAASASEAGRATAGRGG